MEKRFIQSFEEACAITGADPNRLPDVTGLPEKRAKSKLAEHKLLEIRDAQNKLDDFVPDYSNVNQRKWYVWLWFDPSVSAFVFDITYCTGTVTSLGSRFCYADANTAQRICELHIGLINDLMQDI